MSDKVFMMPDGFDEFLQESGICDIPGTQTLLIQHCDDSLVSFLHKVTNNFVVKVLHRLPLKGNIRH
jgi:hypothetical protein